MAELIKIIRTTDADYRSFITRLRQRLAVPSPLDERQSRMINSVKEIIVDVFRRGDAAVAEHTARLDGVQLKPEQFRVSTGQLDQAHRQAPRRLMDAVRRAIDNVRQFQQTVSAHDSVELRKSNARLVLRYEPLRRVAVCVPGASAPLPSSVIMTVVPAQVAGVQEIAVVSPPRAAGDVHSTTLAVCAELGLTEVYRVFGPQAIAALAVGTDAIGRVEKIVGPGSIWVQLAKREVSGLVGIDSFAGPSELVVIADETANAAFIAADLLSQAEHAPGSSILLTPSEHLAEDVRRQLQQQLTKLKRAELTAESLTEYCAIVVTANVDEAIALSNEWAPEHVQLQTADAERLLQGGIDAGAVFVGPYSPVALGDYYAGPSHCLPTAGSARFSSGLTVNDFLRSSSVIHYERKALADAAEDVIVLAEAEGMSAHAESIRIRLRC